MEKANQAKLEIAAVGDISFAGPNADKPNIEIFNSVQPLFALSDIVLANLEGPLYNGDSAIFGKCTIRGNTGWAEILKKVGIDIVSLANNHIMDHGKSGLLSTISALDEEGVVSVGAGREISEACKPQFMEKNGYRVAVLARTSVIVESPSYADVKTPGVAFLNMRELVKNVSACRKQADTVILLMHWGIEHYSFPTPKQRNLAEALIDAGVDIIIGHHPHVVQGFERFGEGLAAYSLGNFVFDEFEWTATSGAEPTSKLKLRLTPENRKSIILKVKIKDKQIRVAPVFTKIDASGSICQDDISQRRKELDKYCGPFRRADYARWWKLYALKREWQLRLQGRIKVKNLIFKIFRLRPGHARDLFKMIRNSFRITTGKSTNPYE